MIAAFTRFDLRNLFSAPARIIAPFAFIVLAGVFTPLPLLAIPTAAAVTSLTVGTPFLNDERGRLDVLYATLPISRRTVVVGRYLEMAVVFIAATILGTATAVTGTLIRGGSLSFGTLALTLSFSFFAAALALSVQLPIFFALGFAKARTAMFLPVLIVVILAVAAQLGGVATARVGTAISDLFASANTSPLAPLIAAAFGLLAVVISAVVSSRIYGKRQF